MQAEKIKAKLFVNGHLSFIQTWSEGDSAKYYPK
jgi:hypothetical protein